MSGHIMSPKTTLTQAVFDEVLREVASLWDLPAEAITAKPSARRFAHARHHVIFQLRAIECDAGFPKYSWLEISRKFAIDHTTAIAGDRSHTRRTGEKHPQHHYYVDQPHCSVQPCLMAA